MQCPGPSKHIAPLLASSCSSCCSCSSCSAAAAAKVAVAVVKPAHRGGQSAGRRFSRRRLFSCTDGLVRRQLLEKRAWNAQRRASLRGGERVRSCLGQSCRSRTGSADHHAQHPGRALVSQPITRGTPATKRYLSSAASAKLPLCFLTLGFRSSLTASSAHRLYQASVLLIQFCTSSRRRTAGHPGTGWRRFPVAIHLCAGGAGAPGTLRCPLGRKHPSFPMKLHQAETVFRCRFSHTARQWDGWTASQLAHPYAR